MENLKINEELSDFNSEKLSPSSESAHQKLDEFISILSENEFDNQTLQELNKKFVVALRTASDSTALQPYVKGSRKTVSEELDGELEQLLFIGQLDKKAYRKNSISLIISRILRIIISLLLILLGFGMIIMPAPPYFEMFTLFYITQNDGVTIMDVISLTVAFIGLYLLVTTITKLRGK